MSRNTTWSLSLCTVKGIPVRVHITFFLLLAWVALDAGPDRDPLLEVLLVLALFACVVLHELSHALTARLFGVRTRDIVLYPFGGVASLLDEAKPKAEFYITLAGPAMNVLIALLLWPIARPDTILSGVNQLDFVTHLFLANVVLAVFNLIPAFPMDGGRILRSGLLLLSVKNATAIATKISQFLSILLAVLALSVRDPILIMIAALVFINAMRERRRDRDLRVAQGFKVQDVMIDLENLVIFQHGITVSQALKAALKSAQRSFPVLCGDHVLGILDKETLIEAAATNPDESYISELTAREPLVLAPESDLSQITDLLQQAPSDAWLVASAGALKGMLTREALDEFLLVEALRKKLKDAGHNEEQDDEW